MDPIKKRKLDENGLDPTPTQTLTESDIHSILAPLTPDQLRNILVSAVLIHPDILSSVRSLADPDISLRKLFIRGLGWDTTSDSLRSVFSVYGPLDEAVVIQDKVTGKSKGYGFVIFKHVDGAVLALKQSSKQIDGRVAVAALASAGGGGPRSNNVGGGDTSTRKIYVGNVGQDMRPERLLSVFSTFGEIEEGPLGFDKATGNSKGFALFVYKTAEAAQAALAEPMKVVDGRQLVCKLASDGKKGKPGGENVGLGQPSGPTAGAYNGPAAGPYNGPGGYSSYSAYSGMGQPPSNQMNPSYNSTVGGQGPGGYGGNTGYGSGGGYGGSGGYGGGGGGSNYGGPNSGGYGGYGGAGSGLGGAGNGGAGPGGYGMPPNSGAGPSGGGYPDSGHYGLSSDGYPGPQRHSTGASPAMRMPPGGVGGYPNPPPYY